MRIAVTGAAGTVGRAVVDLLVSESHDVIPIDRAAPGDRKKPDLAQVDVTDYDRLLGELDGVDAVVHLAAINGPVRHPDHTVHNNNVVASYNVLRAAAEAGIRRVCQASSINAIGGRFSRVPHYDYFPLDEDHPTYAEDPYSLSKWICERQADAIVRRFDRTTVTSLRLHGVVSDRSIATAWDPAIAARQLWGYTSSRAAAAAFLRGITADVSGHEVFYIVAPETAADRPSLELRDTHYPNVPVKGNLDGYSGFFDCSKASRLLGWVHDPS